MSIRHSLLALLADGPRHGYQLRQDFESRTGGSWPLNVGQVYTTLARLDRDGLVGAAGADDPSHRSYRLLVAGERELQDWFTSPVRREERPRDELAIKLAMAAEHPGVDVAAVVQTQRADTIRALQDYTRLKRTADERTADGLAWAMVLDSLVFAADAEVRWLDACEQRLSRYRSTGRPRASEPAEDGTTTPDAAGTSASR